MRKRRGRSVRIYSKGKPDLDLCPFLIELLARKLYEKVTAGELLNIPSELSLGKIEDDNKRR